MLQHLRAVIGASVVDNYQACAQHVELAAELDQRASTDAARSRVAMITEAVIGRPALPGCNQTSSVCRATRASRTGQLAARGPRDRTVAARRRHAPPEDRQR